MVETMDVHKSLLHAKLDNNKNDKITTQNELCYIAIYEKGCEENTPLKDKGLPDVSASMKAPKSILWRRNTKPYWFSSRATKQLVRPRVQASTTTFGLAVLLWQMWSPCWTIYNWWKTPIYCTCVRSVTNVSPVLWNKTLLNIHKNDVWTTEYDRNSTGHTLVKTYTQMLINVNLVSKTKLERSTAPITNVPIIWIIRLCSNLYLRPIIRNRKLQLICSKYDNRYLKGE